MEPEKCPYCGETEKIFACHPFSSDAGEYWVCESCNKTFEGEE